MVGQQSNQAKLAGAPTSPDICCVQKDPAVANYAIQIPDTIMTRSQYKGKYLCTGVTKNLTL